LFWTLPGGKLELGETPEQGLRREVFEETGVSLTPEIPLLSLCVLYVRKPEIEYTYHAYRVQLAHFPSITLSIEHIASLWVSQAEVTKFPFIEGAQEVFKLYAGT